MLWKYFKQQECCDGCPLLENELCHGGIVCYGGEPIEPPCCDFDDDTDMDKWVADMLPAQKGGCGMSEYIDRQALLDAIPPTEEDKQISLYGAVADFIVMVNAIPAADVAPVVHAHWKGYHTQEPYCSNCGFTYDREEGENAQTTDYCGNCGAKMDENEVENLKRCSCGAWECPDVEKDENGKWFIRCSHIFTCGKVVRGNTIEEAVEAWNRRADTDEH